MNGTSEVKDQPVSTRKKLNKNALCLAFFVCCTKKGTLFSTARRRVPHSSSPWALTRGKGERARGSRSCSTHTLLLCCMYCCTGRKVFDSCEPNKCSLYFTAVPGNSFSRAHLAILIPHQPNLLLRQLQCLKIVAVLPCPVTGIVYRHGLRDE